MIDDENYEEERRLNDLELEAESRRTFKESCVTFTSEQWAAPTVIDARSEIAHLLRVAARQVETTTHNRLDSAAWRVADASLRLRRLILAEMPDDLVDGVHERTGLGALLSDERPVDGGSDERE